MLAIPKFRPIPQVTNFSLGRLECAAPPREILQRLAVESPSAQSTPGILEAIASCVAIQRMATAIPDVIRGYNREMAAIALLAVEFFALCAAEVMAEEADSDGELSGIADEPVLGDYGELLLGIHAARAVLGHPAYSLELQLQGLAHGISRVMRLAPGSGPITISLNPAPRTAKRKRRYTVSVDRAGTRGIQGLDVRRLTNSVKAAAIAYSACGEDSDNGAIELPDKSRLVFRGRTADWAELSKHLIDEGVRDVRAKDRISMAMRRIATIPASMEALCAYSQLGSDPIEAARAIQRARVTTSEWASLIPPLFGFIPHNTIARAISAVASGDLSVFKEPLRHDLIHAVWLAAAILRAYEDTKGVQ